MVEEAMPAYEGLAPVEGPTMGRSVGSEVLAGSGGRNVLELLASAVGMPAVEALGWAATGLAAGAAAALEPEAPADARGGVAAAVVRPGLPWLPARAG